MIDTRSDGWKWLVIWLAFASLLDTPNGETSSNPLRRNETPIRKVAQAVIDLGEALLGVIR